MLLIVVDLLFNDVLSGGAVDMDSFNDAEN